MIHELFGINILDLKLFIFSEIWKFPLPLITLPGMEETNVYIDNNFLTKLKHSVIFVKKFQEVISDPNTN